MTKVNTKRHTGIDVRHAASCAVAQGRKCTCSPSYRAMVYSARDERMLRKTFPTLADAKAWRAEAQAALRSGALSAAQTPTLDEAAVAWLIGAESGAVRNRSGDPYKPSAIRAYEQALRLRVLPELGGTRLADIRRADLQGFIDRLLADGHGPSTIRNTLLPVRAIFRRSLARGEVAVNPTMGLELPAVRGRRDRIASPAEAETLLATLTVDRAVWATAMYAGLRLGELLALDWRSVDFDAGVIRVRRSWDPKAGFVTPKSRAGTRTVPLARTLRAHLEEQRRATPWADGLVFGRAPRFRFSRARPTTERSAPGSAPGCSRLDSTSAGTRTPRS